MINSPLRLSAFHAAMILFGGFPFSDTAEAGEREVSEKYIDPDPLPPPVPIVKFPWEDKQQTIPGVQTHYRYELMKGDPEITGFSIRLRSRFGLNQRQKRRDRRRSSH